MKILSVRHPADPSPETLRMDNKSIGVLVAPVAIGNSHERPAAKAESLVGRLRCLGVRGLSRMYRRDERLFVFRTQRTASGIVFRGLSRRDTAVALIGLSSEEEREVHSVLAGDSLHDVCGRLMGDIPRLESLGDVALILWAASAVNYPERRWAWDRLLQFQPRQGAHLAVEIAWALAALCRDHEAPMGDLRERLARRLISGFERASGLFPHVLGRKGASLGSHVSCFADQVYSIHALVQYFRLFGDREALDVALHCARQICRRQGLAGQWWWYYDKRTGEVVEPYPVYAVHQDALAPMALFAVAEATGATFDAEIGLGLDWLVAAPELGGGSLIDESAGLIRWKLARRGPNMVSRYAQTVASRLNSGLRMPGLDTILPARAVDYDRPCHLGWLLHAWPAARLSRWKAGPRSRSSPVSE
jgi:hypothetical protein